MSTVSALLILSIAVPCVEVWAGDSCVTPNGLPGECIPVSKCDSFSHLLRRRPISPDLLGYFTRVICNPVLSGNQDPEICCELQNATLTSSTTETSTTSWDVLANHKNRKLLPAKDECGKSMLNMRVIGGKDAKLGTHPWIVRLGYLTPGDTDLEYGCSGTLINPNYVLTAAHCVMNLPDRAILTKVRLGEYDASTDVDCEPDEVGNVFCADTPVDVDVDDIRPHPDYQRPLLGNDIALVRIKRPVSFTKFVSPVCLPFNDPVVTVDALVAGWGLTDFLSTRSSDVLQHVSVPVVSGDECGRIFQGLTDILPTQLCAGGVAGKDSCAGDSGGPLLLLSDVYVAQIGIVSFGQRRCGFTPVPGVYTKVSEFLFWILDNVKE